MTDRYRCDAAIDVDDGSPCPYQATVIADPAAPPHPRTGERVQLCAYHASMVERGRQIGLHRAVKDPWGVTFMTMFDMAADSHLFRTAAELEEAGYVRNERMEYVRSGDIDPGTPPPPRQTSLFGGGES